MCGRRSRHFSVGSSKLFRVLLASSLLACLVLSPLAAWPTKQAEPMPEPMQTTVETFIPQEVEEPAQPTDLQPTPSTDSKQNADPGLMEQLEELQTQLTSSKRVSQDIKDEFASLVNQLATYFALEEVEDALAEETAAKLESISEYCAAADKKLDEQNAEIEEIKALLKKEKSSKPFIGAGLALGIDEGVPVFGVSAQAGIRFGGSFTASVGGTYMIGSFASPSFGLELDRFTVTGLIGWEF